jgi:formylglycine-generating enzyme required for sulfatase activity
VSIEIDNTIAQAKKRNAMVFVLASIATSVVVIVALIWVFLVNGYVLIVKPDEAGMNYSTQTTKGMTFGSGNNLYVIGQTATIIVSADTFKSVQIDVSAQTPTNIEVVMPPLPALLAASIADTMISSDETTWFVDGYLTNVGESFEQEFEPGEYVIEAKNPYYQPWKQTLSFERAEKSEQAIVFMPFEGQLSLASSPSSAEIYLNDSLLQQTEQTVNGGQYQVRVVQEGFQTIEDTIDVIFENPVQARNYQLIPKQSSLDISVTPSGGTLLINQIEQPPGMHVINANEDILVSYSKDGYFTETRAMRLAPNEAKTLNFALKQAKGKVSVRSTPQAQVFLGKKLLGNTPLEVELQAVEHTLTLSRQGYRSVDQKLLVKPNNQHKISVELLTEYDARRAEGRPLFATEIGIQLKRFAPEAFTMGSRPNEPGRRRNEHPVQVDFDRHIIVSTKEITEAQYARFKSTKSNSNKPQTNVSWIEAAQFTNWLSQKEGLPPFYNIRGGNLVGVNESSTGYRLPTEAEWEWLAKNGKRAMATIYVWGNSDKIPRDSGNFADKSRESKQLITLDDYDDGFADVADVGSFRADRLGMYDLAGNVSEWVHDNYSNSIPDLSTTHINYLGVDTQGQKVVKGGNYTTGKLRDLRAAFRDPANEGSDTIGFRIARYAD